MDESTNCKKIISDAPEADDVVTRFASFAESALSTNGAGVDVSFDSLLVLSEDSIRMSSPESHVMDSNFAKSASVSAIRSSVEGRSPFLNFACSDIGSFVSSLSFSDSALLFVSFLSSLLVSTPRSPSLVTPPFMRLRSISSAVGPNIRSKYRSPHVSVMPMVSWRMGPYERTHKAIRASADKTRDRICEKSGYKTESKVGGMGPVLEMRSKY
mmetsp:Transcript_25431/g.46078  ORF Transcript_25431/g.46078 Transcript_25431/m.46078 type:complete len:213 (-) Transcript_25431:1258-1896(-)